MTKIAATSPTASAGATIAISRSNAMAPRTGPLRSGNPRGNPNLAPRCGAKARTTGCACRAPGGGGDGERAVQDAWREEHRAAHAGGPRQPGVGAHHARKVRPGGAGGGAAAGTPARQGDGAAGAGARRGLRPPALAAAGDGGAAARGYRDRNCTRRSPPRSSRLHRPRPLRANRPTARRVGPPPPGHRPHLRRDARGRFAPAPSRLPRGRQAERAQARAEAAALAPWKLAIAQARVARRRAVHPDQTAESEKSCKNPTAPRREQFGQEQTRHLPRDACPGGGTVAHLAGPDGANDAGRAATPVQRETVAHLSGPAGPDDAGCAETFMQRMPPGACPGGGTVTHRAVSAGADNADRAATLMQRETVAHATGPAGEDDAGRAETSMQRLPPGACPGDGTVAHLAGPDGANDAGRAATPMQRETVAHLSGPARPDDAGRAETFMQRMPPGACPGGGTAAPRTGAAGADNAGRAATPMQRETVARLSRAGRAGRCGPRRDLHATPATGRLSRWWHGGAPWRGAADRGAAPPRPAGQRRLQHAGRPPAGGKGRARRRLADPAGGRCREAGRAGLASGGGGSPKAHGGRRRPAARPAWRALRSGPPAGARRGLRPRGWPGGRVVMGGLRAQRRNTRSAFRPTPRLRGMIPSLRLSRRGADRICRAMRIHPLLPPPFWPASPSPAMAQAQEAAGPPRPPSPRRRSSASSTTGPRRRTRRRAPTVCYAFTSRRDSAPTLPGPRRGGADRHRAPDRARRRGDRAPASPMPRTPR